MSNRDEEKGSRLRTAWRVTWLLALAAVFLEPAIRTGYWSEDLYLSIMPRAGSVIHGNSLLGEVLNHIKVTLNIGRFFPLTPTLVTTVHYIFQDAWTYKAFIVACGILDVFLFYCLASKLGGRRDYGCFAACLTIGLIQYRVAVDPCLGFSGQMQLLIAGLFLTLLTLQKHLETRAWAWLLASGLFYFACALLYETSYLLILLPLVLILRSPDTWTRRAWTALPFFAAAGFCAFETFLIRWLFPSNAYWQKPNFDPSAVALGIVHQASAGFPLTYFAFDPLKIFPRAGRGNLLGWLLDFRVALVALPAFGLSFLCLRGRNQDRDASAERAPAPGGVGWWTLIGLGLILAIVPTVAIGISPYHRVNLSLGVGWIPALIEYYGVGLILSTVLWNAVSAVVGGGSRARWKCLAASMVVALLVGVTYRANLDVVRCFNARLGAEEYRDSVGAAGGSRDAERLLLQAALDSGLMDPVPDRSIVQSAHQYPFWYDASFTRFFYAARAGKQFLILPPATGAGPDGYRVRDVLLGPDSGYVVLSRGIRGPLTPDDQPPSGGLRLFVRHPELASLPFQVTSQGVPTIAGRELRAIKSGRDWAIYSLEALEKPVAPESLQVVFDPAHSPREIAKEPSKAIH
jgi:hypothetical protein